MTSKRLAILNSLVTFAAENVPGGLSADEREVAQIVGRWARGWTGEKEFDYKTVNPTHFSSIEEAANSWAERGWRVVAVNSDNRPGYANSLILERPVGVSHPDD